MRERVAADPCLTVGCEGCSHSRNSGDLTRVLVGSLGISLQDIERRHRRADHNQRGQR